MLCETMQNMAISEHRCNGPRLPLVVAIGASIYMLRRHRQGRQFKQPLVRIDGQVVIITGCNSGIGKETAIELARRGCRVYMACRDEQRCEAARQDVMRLSGSSTVFNRQLDLSSQASIRAFVKRFEAEETRLDILINNAAVIIDRQLTVDGHEMQFATNHLGPFLLTNLLLPLLRAAAPSRVVNVSSKAHELVHLNRDDLMHELSYNKCQVYGRTKLANVLFTRELARRLAGTGVTANALNPGIVNTDIFRNTSTLMRVLLWPVLLVSKTVRSGAQTTIMVALAPELSTQSGQYYEDCLWRDVAPQAKDDEMAEWLWRKSAELTGLATSD